MTRRSTLPGLFLLIPLGASTSWAQEDEVSALARDPDRGLEPALRARLALADAADDSIPAERWAALIAARLERVAELWSQDRLVTGLATETWIASELRVAPFFDTAAPVRMCGGWSVARATLGPPTPREASFAQALAAWRGLFSGESRLAFEPFALAGEEPLVEASLRASASGLGAQGRLQHDVVWHSRWRIDASGAELVALDAGDFVAVTRPGHPEALFEDVSASLFVDPALHREQVAPGLDDWRRSLSAALEPGALGHHGLALGDVNGDGLEDLYWCRPGGLPNKLLLHTSDDGVVDASAGVDLLDYSASALLLELDGDGDLDLVVSTGTGLVFFANDGGGRFEQRRFLARSLATSLAAADFDADGDLDLYACSYVSPYEKGGIPLPYHQAENGEANTLLRNDGEWAFVDATVALGLDENNRRFSLAAAWEDYDEDGDPDLYVANDFGCNNLYRNEGGHFTDVAAELGALDVSAGMGVTWGDVDADGWMDLYVTNMHSLAGSRLTARADFRPGSSAEALQAYRHHALGNTLLLNEQGRAFRDVSEATGTHLGRWGWGAIFFDLDDDGTLDLFAPNGFVTGEERADLDGFFWRQVVLQSPERAGDPDESYRLGWRAVNRLVRQGRSWNGNERNVAWLGLGAGAFVDVSSVAGLDHADDSRAAARVDWDGDGDEDLLVTNRTAPMLRLLRNGNAGSRRWIAFTLRSQARATIGARVRLETGAGKVLVRTLRCGEGYLAQSSARLHFGLGAQTVARVTVRWPDGTSEDFGSPDPGQTHVLERGSGRARPVAARTTPSRLRAASAEPAARRLSARTVLPTPLPLPRLALETSDGRPASLLGIGMQGPRGTGHGLLVVLWSSSAPASRRALEGFGAAAEALAGADLQVLALDVDPPEERERAHAWLAQIGWPFGHGSTSEEALAILEQVQGALHQDERALALPAAFLVDPGGLLVATYQGRLEPAQVRADLALFTLGPEERRSASVPFTGRWIAPPPGPFDETVAARLAAHGLERPAAEYRLARVEVRQSASAQLLYETGVTHQQQGRFADAAASYRQALAVDPGHLRAAQNLAVALHQAGDLLGALDAYRQALALDPGHARTRSNLGHLYLDLDDVASAQKELAALLTLQSELAPKLEERIRAVEPR